MTKVAGPIIGHEWVVELFDRTLASGRLAQAYLMAGPPQVGKMRLSLYLAQALNCQGEERPCGKCPPCRLIERGLHPDVQVIEGDGEGISIDQIRELQHGAALSPYQGAYRIYIIRQIEEASLEAVNCLLKTLEEPAPKVVLILTAVNTSLLPETLLSRCQVLVLHPLAIQQVEKALVEVWGAGREEARLLARLSRGRMGWAIQALEDKKLLEHRERHLERLWKAMEGGRVERWECAQELSQEPEAVQEALAVWCDWWRDLLLAKAHATQGVVNLDRMPLLAEQAARYDLPQMVEVLTSIQRTAFRLGQNVNLRLALEVLLLDLPRLGEMEQS